LKIEQIEPVHGIEEKEALMKYMDSGAWLMEHKKTRELEQMICDLTKSKYCHMLPNGTQTLMAGLVASGVKPGDEVIVPDYTIIASATCASFIGAKPVFVDVDPETFAIDVNHLKERITDKTKAIMLVYMNARPARDWVEIFDLAQEKGIPVVEDSAQCLGSYYNVEESKIHMGTLGKVGSFSFSASKIITMGSGGAVVTDDKEIAEEIKFMKNFGRVKGGRDVNLYPGIDMKFNDVQAVIGIEQMKKLPYRVKRKKEQYKLYKDELEGVVDFVKTDLKYTCPWMVDIMCRSKAQRAKLITYLSTKGIGTRKFYPAIHTQEAYTVKDPRFYRSTDIANRGLWLPSTVSLDDETIVDICKEVKKGLK